MHRVDRVRFVDWIMDVEIRVFDFDGVVRDLKGCGEHIVEVGTILTRIGYVPGYLCDPPVLDEKVPAHKIEFFYKNPFIEDDNI